jgi:nitroreductase
MELFDAIYGRQSSGKVKPDPLPHALIEKLLGAAVQAPNHHRVRPWRFVVLEGMARERLGDVMAQAMQQRDPQTLLAALDVERARPLRAPVLIAVGVDRPAEPKVVEIENVCAAAAAAQNLLLAAHALGLAAMWRTGPAALDPLVKAFLGLSAEQHLIGFIYLGYPLSDQTPVTRPGYEDRVTWLQG